MMFNTIISAIGNVGLPVGLLIALVGFMFLYFKAEANKDLKNQKFVDKVISDAKAREEELRKESKEREKDSRRREKELIEQSNQIKDEFLNQLEKFNVSLNEIGKQMTVIPELKGSIETINGRLSNIEDKIDK